MQQHNQSTLDVICENWRSYQEKLRDGISPLTNEQLLLQPAPHLWPLGQIVQHIIYPWYKWSASPRSLSDGRVSRIWVSTGNPLTFPVGFICVAAMNPCRSGF